MYDKAFLSQKEKANLFFIFKLMFWTFLWPPDKWIYFYELFDLISLDFMELKT